jgi:hypothetical protein
MNLSKAVKTMRIKPDGSGYTVVAGTSNVNSDIVDTAGFDGVRFIIGFGTITSGAVTSIKVQENSANSTSGMADILGSSITVADTDDNKIAISDYVRPLQRYLRLSTLRATQNSVIDFVIVELYRARSEPITDDTSVISSEFWASPAEGTA